MASRVEFVSNGQAGAAAPATSLWTVPSGRRDRPPRRRRRASSRAWPACRFRQRRCGDGTGVPMRRSELEGLAGKQEDGSAGTREAKVVVTFTAEGTNRKTGEPMKDEGSDRVSALIDSAASVGGVSRVSEFAGRAGRQFCREGVCAAREVVLVSDGAAWITNVADELLAGMRKTCIPDLFHALEYASEAVKVLIGCKAGRKARLAGIKALLPDGKVGRVIAELQPCRGWHKAVAKCIDHYASNRERMRHDEYRARGMQIGSGQVESSCKQMVAARFKKSGSRWSKRGANALPALKSCRHNSQREEFAEWRVERLVAA